jgi:hypothetical protein
MTHCPKLTEIVTSINKNDKTHLQSWKQNSKTDHYTKNSTPFLSMLTQKKIKIIQSEH